jgi:hypothetical protein
MGIWDKLRGAFGSERAREPSETPKNIFAREVEAVLRAAFPAASVERLPDVYGFRINRGHGDQALFLDNLFSETRDIDPQERRQRIQRLVRSTATPDIASMTWEEVRPKLVPLLRTPSLFSGLAGLEREKLPVSRPLAPLLVECLGVDSDDGISYVAPHVISAWGVQASDVFEAATKNARAYFVDDIGRFDSDAPYPIWHVARDDSYESSRLLVPGWLASFDDKVTGKPVAIVPHRSLLIVGGDGDERCLRRLIDTAKAEFGASPRGISPALYTTGEDGKIIPLVLPAGHHLATDVVVGHLTSAKFEYDTQKAHLDKQLGEDVFVASFVGLQDKDGLAFSYSTWSKGVPTLLPRTDRVALNLAPGQKEPDVIHVRWDALTEVAGSHLVREPGLDPPRWRTNSWPDDTTLAKLRARAIT